MEQCSVDLRLPKSKIGAGVSPASRASRRIIRLLGATLVVVPALGFVGALLMFHRYPPALVQHILFCGLYLASTLGISVGFHRFGSHCAFKVGGLTKAIMIICGSIAAQGPIIYWVANHRRHHSFADREGDVHSPHLHGDGVGGMLRGLWHAHTGWIFDAEMTDWVRYVPDLLRDQSLFALNNQYFFWVIAGLILPGMVGGVVTHSLVGAAEGFLWGGLGRTFLVHHVTWAINSWCHSHGSRPFRTPDKSTNHTLLALLAVGEGWHNNHHACPPAASFATRWWQLDIGGIVIRCLEILGLVSDVRRRPARADLSS
jgi:stearoyl-CoA desaturase (delta-9 desaturase)